MKTRLGDFIKASRTLIEGDEQESVAAVKRVLASEFSDPEGLFYLTRHLARLNQVEPALKVFERVVAGGFFCLPAILRDPWLDPVRKTAEFEKLLKKVEQQHQAASEEFTRLDGQRILESNLRSGR